MLIFVASMVPFLMIGISSLMISEKSLEASSSDLLVAVRDNKKAAIERYFADMESQIKSLATSNATIKAMGNFSKSFVAPEMQEADTALKQYWFEQFGAKYQTENGKALEVDAYFQKLSPAAVYYQTKYIANNPNPLGSKNALINTQGGTAYDQDHALFHDMLNKYLQEFGFYDIFFVSKKGDVVYSVFKELDYATSLYNGPWANSGLAESFKQSLNAKQGDVSFTDLSLYVPSYDAPAGFVSTPIYKGSQFLGVLIFQMPLDRISQIMSGRSGLGETGETYLVGQDHLMRSDAYLDPETHSVVGSFKNPKTGSVNSEAVVLGLKGESGVKIIRDYNGNQVVSAFAPIVLGGNQWVLIAEKDVSEAFASSATLQKVVVMIGLAGLLFIVLMGYLFGNALSKPVIAFTNTLREISRTSNFSMRVESKQQDEVGQAAVALNELLSSTDMALQETNKIVKAMSNGDFSRRIEASLEGDLNQLKQGLNHSMNTIEEVMQQVNHSVKEIACGNFAQNVAVNASGVYLELQQNLSTSTKTLAQVMGDIRRVIDEMSLGNFQEQITVEAHGDLLNLKNNINDSLHTIAQAIQAIGKVVKAQAEGDLTQQLPDELFKGELSALKDAINDSMLKTKESVKVGVETSRIVSVAAQEVSAGANTLSSRVQEQATALEQTSISMKEMSSQIQQNTQSSLSARSLAEDMREYSLSGVEIMN